MAPVLVAGTIVGGIVLIVEMPGTLIVEEHTIRVIHEELGRREVHLRPKGARVIALNGGSRGHIWIDECRRWILTQAYLRKDLEGYGPCQQ